MRSPHLVHCMAFCLLRHRSYGDVASCARRPCVPCCALVVSYNASRMLLVVCRPLLAAYEIRQLLFAVCCMKSGACCPLPVARCMLFAAHCPLHGAWSLDVVCCTRRGVGCIFAVCCMPSVGCCTGLLHVAPCVSSLHALHCVSHALRCPPHGPMSHGMRRPPPAPGRLSSVARCGLRVVSCPLHLSRSHVAGCLPSVACPIFHVACRPAAE